MPADSSSVRPVPRLLDLPSPWLVGVVHLPALPGSPGARLGVQELSRMAAEDACRLAEAGFGAVVVENHGDAPFRAGRVDPETIAAMAVVTDTVARAVSVPVGVNVLRRLVLHQRER